MNRPLTNALAFFTVLASASHASAQLVSAIDGSPVESRLKTPENDIGVRLSESSTLHVGITAEGGYDSNVFYNDQNRVESAILRIIPSFQISNVARDGTAPQGAYYSLGASLTYREYLTDNEDVRAQRAFNPSVSGSLGVNGQSISTALSDQFTRSEDPPYQPRLPTIRRDFNVASASVSLVPGGGRLATQLRYTNTLDHFEGNEYKYASNMSHDGMLDISWKWLPKTALYLQGGGGYIHYLQDTPQDGRKDSTPYRALVGLRGLVTPKLTTNLGVGYATAIYQDDTPHPTGLSNLLVGFDLALMPTVLNRIGIGYSHGFRNSPVIGTYYDLDAGSLYASQMIARLVATLFGRYEYRRYHGIMMGSSELARRDNVVLGGAQLDYYLQKWIYAGIAYAITVDRANTDELPMGAMNPLAGLDYTKQQVFARVGVTY
jgi:hypothetical protein